MELDVAKLVAFALWAESNEGVAGKAPGTLSGFMVVVQAQNSIHSLRALLGEDFEYKWDNYLTAWEAAEEPEAPAPEEKEAAPILITRDEAANGLRRLGVPEDEINAKLGALIEEAPASSVAEKPEPVEALETPTEDPPKPKKQRGKREK